MGRTFEEILNEMYPSVADNDGKNGANTAIPSFVSDYSEEGKQKETKEGNLAFEQMQKHTGVIAPEEVEKIEAPKTYNEIYEETSKDVLASDLARKGVSVFNFDKMMKESAKSFNMENWQKAKRIADAKASDNVSADDVDSTIKDIFAQSNKNDLVDVEDVLSSLRYKDAEGNTYYGFKGKRLYGDDLARDIVGNYVDERNHWINMGDSAYREQWSQSKYGIPFEDYAKGRAEFLEDKFKPVAEAAEVYYEEQGKIPQMSLDGEPIVDNIALELGKLRSATNAFRDNTFWRGVEAGSVEAIRTATFDFGGVIVSAEQEDALNKYLKGEELNAKERLLVEMAKYNQILGEEKSKYRKGFDAADVGEGLIGSIGFMASLGAQSALGIGKSIGKGLAEASVKEAFNRSIKEGVKLGLAKTGAWMANTSARTALSTMPYQDYAQRRLSHFQFTDNGLMKEEVNPFADMYRAYASTFAEIAAEDFGGLLDDGMKAFGVKMANAKFFNKLSGSKFADRLKDFTPAQAVIGGLKGMKLNSMVGEVAEEYVTAAIQPLVTGEFFSTINEDGLMPAFNKHYADALTSEFALNTFAVCGALSAGGTLAKGVSGAMTAVEITNLRKDTKALLEGISDEPLRNTLYTAINSNEADRFAPLTQMKWNSISADDASAALKVIFSDAKTHAMRGEAMETERLKVFSPYLLGAINKSYRGVDVANPTPTTEVVDAYALDEAGNEVPIGNVIYGDMDNPNAIVQVVDANGMVRNVPVAGTKFVRTSLSDYISEQYAMMFSTSISKERLNELIENVRGITKMDKEAYDKVLEENGFSVYRKGENVVLADGRFGTVRGGADSGSYIVDVTDANGNKTTELVGFESILHPTDLSMAEAQAEAQAEGSMAAPIVLPTTKDGRVSLDGINDGKVLARVLPSQMGGKQKAIEAIDAEIQRLETEQSKPTEQTGLDAMAEANERAESTASRIKVLQDARKALAEELETPTEQTPIEETATPTAEEVESKRRERQAEMDAMSTFDFSRDYRRRNLNTKISHNTLHKLIDNINEELKQVTGEAERKVLEHRKAQYEQTLKDMGAKKTIGEDAEFKALVEKASEALGLPIIVTDEPFANSRQNGKHRVSKDGNAIYINSRSTRTEQSVGILAHEIVHEFKQFLTPEEWAKFEGVIMTARFGKDWANSEAYKKEIKDIQDAERRSGHAQGVGDEKAREEAVAYAIQDYIFNGADGVRAFEAIVNQDLNWRDKLMEALRKVVDKLKSLFNGENKAVQEAIAEFENVFKRYAQKSGEIKAEQIEGETAAIINEKDGQSSFSLSTYEDGGRDILQNFLTSQVEGGKLDQKDANAILTEMDAIYDICMDYKDEYAPFGAWSEAAVVRDDEGMPVFSVIKANGDYAMNLDFSLVCKKRRTLDAVLNEMIGRKLIEIAPDDPTFIAKVNDIVRKYGFETACRLCFVDAKRFRVVSTARNFCKLYNGVVAKLMPTDKKVAINSFDAAGVGYPTHEGSLDTLADSELNIKALEDILKRNGEKTVIAKIARHLLEHPEDRKLVHISDFVSTRGFDPTKALNPQILSLYNSKKGSGGPKASFSDVQYLNDVIYADWNKEDAYAVGGVRVQSFSDYVPRMVFDYMQMVADLAAKQMPVHAYTKEAAFAKTFGLTGMKINMSLVPTVVEGGIAAGLDADGNYAWEEGETFDYDTAIEIQNADGYRENCGTIAVGVSDEHIDKMLDDDNIRMVIPYHKSGLNKAVAIANNIDAFKDYTNQQNTRYADGTKLSSADSKNVPNFNEDTRRLGDPRKAADAYLAWCKENNYKPKFDKWASHPNYYKLLEDFTTLVDGEYFEQRGVTMTFPKEGDAFGSLSNLIAESLEEDAVLEGKRDSLVGAMVDEIESTLFSNREKALESSNSLQKQPDTQEVVGAMDVESYSISRNNEATIDKWLGKREDFTDEVKSAFKEYIAEFKPATQLATTKWFANGVIRIPEDMPKVEQAMEIAQRKKVDALQYNSPMELIEQFGVVAPKEKLINPDDVPTLSNKVQVPNTDITIYDVDDSEESRKNFRELMNSHLGKESSPWCLLQADKNGVLTKESARYWKHYNRYPKRAAFSNGKLVAFFASDDEPTWWDRMDQPHNEIPIVGKIKGDALGRTATMLYNESGELVGYDDIHKGDRKNGLYEEWYNLEQMHRRGYFKDGQRDGVFETWHPNGVREAYAEFVGNLTGNLVEEWNHRGTLVRRELKNDSGSVAATALWYNSGKQRKLVITTTGHNISRAFLIWDVVGNLEMFEYTNGNISEEYDYQFQKYIVRNGGERKEYNLRKINAKKQKTRAEKIREMYHADKVADIESIEDVDKMLEQISNDLASTKDSFSIDRSQYLEEPEIDRAYTSRQMDRIEDNAKKNNPFGIAQSIDLYEKFAVDEEKKKAQGKMSAIEEKYAQEVINSYRAVANYGRAILAEQFPDYAANTHANNLKSGKTNLAMVRGLFQEYNSDEYMAELFDLVSSVAEKFGTTFRLATIKGAHGNHVANTVQYNTATLNSGTISDQDKARIILHEMIHAATGEGVELCENARLREVLNVYPSTKLRTSVRRLKTLLEDIRNNEEFKGEYGITTVHEMLAELSNPRFVEKLKAHTIWTRVVDAIREIAYAITKMVTGKDLAKSDAYTEVRTTLTEIIEETPMEFIEGLNRLRDAGRIKGVKPLEAESVEEIASLAESEGTTSFSLVREEAKIAELEASPKRIGYRNVILNEDGSFSSPMATHIGNTGKGKVKSATFNLGEWEEAEENPQLVDEQGKVYIYKDNGGSVKVAYDPYIHNRLDKVNAQFKEAWKRPNLVYVETEVPITDLESGYHADKAKLPVGVHPWSNGDLMLSRYDKPIRIVSWEEVADDWVARFKDRGVEFDIVPPALLPILKERGVEILPPHKGLGADATEAYEASRGEESFSILREEDTDTIFATAKEEFASTNDWLKTGWLMPDGTQLDFAEGGDYRGTDHRAIGAAYKGVAEHQWQYLQDFESRGGIRIHMNRDGKYGTIEMTIKPTAEQKKRLRSFIGAVGGNVDVDFMDENYNTAHSASYEGVSPARVLSGITNFYDEGIKPKGNVSYSLERTNEQFNSKLSALTEENSRSIVLNLGMPSAILISCGVDNKPIRLYGAKLLAKAKKHNYDVNDLRDLPLYIAAPIAVFKGVYEGSFAILTEVKIGERNVLAALTVGKGGHDVEFNIVTSVYDKRQDSLVRWINNGRLLYADKEKALNYFSVSAPIAEAQNNQELNSVDKDTTINPKNQISEQDSFSLNRDNTTVATPELEAEANEELSKEAKLAAELEEAQNTIDRMVRKLNAVTERKEMTFDEVKAFLLDSDTMSGLQEASAGQYKRIIRNVLNVLENTPNKRIKVESLVDRIQRELLSARLNLANSNLKAVAKDFKSIITKKREGRNTRGEAIAKYVDNTTRKMMEQFIKTIEYAHSFTDENNKTTTKWENILLAGRIFTNDAIDEAMATLRESLVEEYDEVKDGLLSLLEVYKTMRDCAADVQDVYTKQVGAERDIQDIKEEIDTLQGLLDIYHSGAKGFGKALREIRGMGYNTISDAEARVKALQGTLKALRGEIHSYKQEEADSINRLVEAVKDMNTAILGVDKEGRVALKEELAKKREAMGEFKKGVFRSVRSPHYGKVSSESAKQADKLPYWQRRDMVRRGNVMFSDVTETFEFGLRRMDRMSIANEWLQDGIYYQFIMHPTDGVIARSDWRYKTEKGLRNAFEEEARKRFAPNVKDGKFKFSDLKERVKEKSGIVITTIESRINGEPVDKAKPTTIDLTVGQLLYIRAMVKQQGGINGYLTLGLKAEQIEAIVKETEERYPEFCEFDDWIRGEEGILEQIYKIRNEIYRKIYGRDLDHTEGYFPIERMKGAIKKSEDVGETIDASTISGGIGSNKKRVRNSTPMNIDVDYFEKLDKHISESIQWCAGAELIEKMNALLSSSEFRNILEAQGFSKTAFKNSFKRAIGERLGGEEGKDTTAGKVLNSIGKNAVVSNIAFNLNSALKQLVSISATLSNEVSPKLWMYFAKNALVPSAVKKGVATLVDSFMGDDSPIDDVVSLPLFFSCYKWAKENVPTFANRADNETMGFDIFELEGVEKWDRFANKIKEWGMKPNVLMDLFTCSILTKTYYDYQYDRNIERGMTEQEAHDDARMRASVLMNQTQQSSEGAFVSKYQSDRLTGAAAFFRAGTVAYQNSQLGFDRNARSAYQNIATMLYDMYGKQGAYDKVIEYQAEQYENRGIVKDKAMKMAKADYRRSFLTQCNVLLHNMLLNNTLWAMSGVMTMYVAQAASFIVLAFLGGSGYGDEATEISFENIHKEVAKQLRNSWWVYTIPMSQSLIGKPIADLAGVASTFTSAKHPATLQPLFDTKSAIDKLFTVIEKEDDEEVKLQMGALGLVAFDTATRYGLGLSAKNALRIAGGVYGIAKDGETENFMNVLSSPRYLTKEFAGRPRKDETMDEYTERVSGLYKIIHSFSKGEDVSKLRKQYIDRMDEIMFYDTDFDYDKFKEDKKRVERLSKGLVYSATYNDKANEYRYRLKENKADKLESMSDEQSVEEAKLAEIKANVKYIDKFLKANVGWDTDMAEERELLFRAEQEHIDNFLNEYANYKNIK